jgi:hypothetical protein
VRDTVAVDLPQPAAVEETDGIGGLFANAERDEPPAAAPPSPPLTARPVPAATPPAAPQAAPPPMPPLTAAPRTAVLTSSPAATAPPVWQPTAPVSGRPAPPPRTRSGTRTALLVAGILGLVVLLGVGGLLLLRDGGNGGPSGGSGGAAAPTAETPTGPQVGDVETVDGVSYRLEAARADATCVGHGYGEVGDFFAGTDCTGLARALYSAQLDGRPVVVSVSRVRMADTATARSLQQLTDRNGTGNVSDLLREGFTYSGGPPKLGATREYASKPGGAVVTIVETDWASSAAGSSDQLDTAAEAGTDLPVAAFSG